MEPEGLSALSEEFAGVELGDRRRAKRLEWLVNSAMNLPGGSLPLQAGGPSEVEALYRFLRNAQIDAAQVLAPHLHRTADRCRAAAETVVVHDTSEFEFSGEVPREGLGTRPGEEQIFRAHYSLALNPQGKPLGVVALRAWRREGPAKGKRRPRQLQVDENRESLRWHEAVEEVVERLGTDVHAVHVMDREADAYELFAHMCEMEQRFVIRIARDRNVEGNLPGDPKLFTALDTAPIVLERTVQLSKRSGVGKNPRQNRLHPPRKKRQATLHVRVTQAMLKRTENQLPHLPDCLSLNFVDVREPNPPEGEEAVHWRLVTTEPIETPEDVARVIDLYRLRWQIEEYFKSLKTGCAIEKRQLESAKTLIMALVIFSVVAWRLLLLRWMERHDADAPATAVLTPRQLEVLQAVTPQRIHLSNPPTCREILLAVAALGAHLPSNGPPGWQVIGRGLDKLHILEEGWAARDGPSMRSEM